MNPLTGFPLPGTMPDPLYPESDGKPVSDSDLHLAAMIWLLEALQDFLYPGSGSWYVAANLLFYYEQGNPGARCSPDGLGARGVGSHYRLSYRLWEEGVVPSTFFEIASRRTWRADIGPKRPLYAGLGIAEDFVFDPHRRFLDPVLQGFRRRGNPSVALRPAADGRLTRRELGLRLVPEGSLLRLVDVATGRPIPTRAELAEQERRRSRQQRRRAQEERQRAEQALAELERLRARMRGLGIDPNQ